MGPLALRMFMLAGWMAAARARSLARNKNFAFRALALNQVRTPEVRELFESRETGVAAVLIAANFLIHEELTDPRSDREEVELWLGAEFIRCCYDDMIEPDTLQEILMSPSISVFEGEAEAVTRRQSLSNYLFLCWAFEEEPEFREAPDLPLRQLPPVVSEKPPPPPSMPKFTEWEMEQLQQAITEWGDAKRSPRNAATLISNALGPRLPAAVEAWVPTDRYASRVHHYLKRTVERSRKW